MVSIQTLLFVPLSVIVKRSSFPRFTPGILFACSASQLIALIA
nr:MAG TPA: hypothetical protein [Bacteriophage sp.]